MISHRQSDFQDYMSDSKTKDIFAKKFYGDLQYGNLLRLVIALKTIIEGFKNDNPNGIQKDYNDYKGLGIAIFPEEFQDTLQGLTSKDDPQLIDFKNAIVKMMKIYHESRDYKGVEVRVIYEDDNSSEFAGRIKNYKFGHEHRSLSWVEVEDGTQFNIGNEIGDEFNQVSFVGNTLTLRIR